MGRRTVLGLGGNLDLAKEVDDAVPFLRIHPEEVEVPDRLGIAIIFGASIPFGARLRPNDRIKVGRCGGLG